MEYKAEFDSNAPPEMLEEEESMDDIKNRLGSLADSNEVEGDIGPAPDGFEAPEEALLPQEVQPVPAQKKQPVMVKSPQKVKVLVKAPAQAKMPVKRPAPAG